MTRLWRVFHSQFAFGTLGLALGLSQGCARSEPSHRPDVTSSATKQDPPFQPNTDPASTGAQSGVSLDPAASGLPFRTASHPRIVPSGTLLTVELEDSLSTATVRADDPFTASVAAPLTIDGDTLIGRGSPVTGRIESTQSQADHPGLAPGSGYFRLTLTSITVAGRAVALHTSSLFAREAIPPSTVLPVSSPSDLHADGARFQKGRRLTFRLTAPVLLDDPNSVANRENGSPDDE
jgi:hypothetical protein